MSASTTPKDPDAALEWAVEEARVRHAHLEAVHVWHSPYVPTGPFVPAPVPDDETFEADARATLDASVNAVDGAAHSEPIERKLVCAGAVVGLLAAAKGADLLVVGSRGRGGFSGLLLGSVSQEVAHHATCPVVIVPSVGK